MAPGKSEEERFAAKALQELRREDVSPGTAARCCLSLLAVVKTKDWSRVKRASGEADSLAVADALQRASDAAGVPLDYESFAGLNPDNVRKLVSIFDRIAKWEMQLIQAIAEAFAIRAIEGYQTTGPVAELMAEIARPPAGATLFDPVAQGGLVLLRSALRAGEESVCVRGWSYYDDAAGPETWKVAALVLHASGVHDVRIDPAPPVDEYHTTPAPPADVVVSDLTEVPARDPRREWAPKVQGLLSNLAGSKTLVILVPNNHLAKAADLKKFLADSGALAAMIRLPASQFPRVLHDVDLLALRGDRASGLDREILFVDLAAYFAADRSRSLDAGVSREVGEIYEAFLSGSEDWKGESIARFARAIPLADIRRDDAAGPELEVAFYVPLVVEPIDLRTELERLRTVERERQAIEADLERRIEDVLDVIRT